MEYLQELVGAVMDDEVGVAVCYDDIHQPQTQHQRPASWHDVVVVNALQVAQVAEMQV